MAHYHTHHHMYTTYHTILRRPLASRWPVAILVPLLLVLAACSAGAKTAATTGTATTASTTAPGAATTPTTAATSAGGPSLSTITPIPGDYSVYVDPTWGYSFEYPSNWVVRPAVGQSPDGNGNTDNVKESNVNISDPTPPDEQHPLVMLIVRGTNNDSAQFVQRWLCGSTFDATVSTAAGSFKSVTLTENGGDPVSGYAAPAYGAAFFANGMAFEVWLQSSAKLSQDIAYFFDHQKANFNHILNTFNPGPKVQTLNSCQ